MPRKMAIPLKTGAIIGTCEIERRSVSQKGEIAPDEMQMKLAAVQRHEYRCIRQFSRFTLQAPLSRSASTFDAAPFASIASLSHALAKVQWR